jgi:hypothetical protein
LRSILRSPEGFVGARRAVREEIRHKVKIWRASSIKVLQRAISEAAAKRYEVDAIHMSARDGSAVSEKLLQRLSPYFKT